MVTAMLCWVHTNTLPSSPKYIDILTVFVNQCNETYLLIWQFQVQLWCLPIRRLWVSMCRSSEKFSVTLCTCAHRVKRDSIMMVDILSGKLLVSHAPALLSGIFIPILHSTNRSWLAAAGTARLHTRIRVGLHENCATNGNRPAALGCTPEVAGWGSDTARV